jgi:hypothetical protein
VDEAWEGFETTEKVYLISGHKREMGTVSHPIHLLGNWNKVPVPLS